MGTLYIVMGARATRKSATIRALTGFARGHRPWLVGTIGGNPRNIFVISASPQEAPDLFQAHVETIYAAGPEFDVLLALRPDEKAVDFVGQIPPQNSRPIRWVLLGGEEDEVPPELREILPGPDLVIPTSREMPANEIAHEIRPRWGWL
jgi:hypothetical protein